MTHLDPDALATLVAVVDSGGFTSAAERIGKTQAAVSVKIANLEAQLGQRLLARSRRGTVPTDAGEAFLGYARRILAIEDEALAAFGRDEAIGRVRLGIPDDYVETFVTPLIGRFAAAHPGVQVEIRCDLSVRLETELARGDIDLAVVTRDPEQPKGEVLRREPLIWCASADHFPERVSPLPLAVFCEGCRSRPRILGALDTADIAWRIAYTSSHMSGILSAVASGFALTALVESALPVDWRRLGVAENLPPLPHHEIALMLPPDASGAARRLARLLRAEFIGEA